MEEKNQSINQNEADDFIAHIIKTVNRYYQEVTITKVTGDCPYGHQKGENYKVTSVNHDGLCGSLYHAIHAPIVTLHYGGGIIWERDESIFKGLCPEMGKVQVEVKRFEKKDFTPLKTRTDTRNMTGKGFTSLDKYRVFVEILSIANKCMWGHKEGERYEVDPFNIGKICGFLYWEAYHFINLLFAGGSLPWEAEKNIVHGVCPDSFNQVSFRLIREER
ncbi:MAG: hypothetical protein AMJ42_06630 [Deltaproteobacteria bacterium DG_8]|nr:MAG: hypothetical protein AMJ42_06630 [Deltaproteobacteria bacterium DG_8]